MFKKKPLSSMVLIAGLTLSATQAQASLFTNTSPLGTDVTTVGASTIGGIVVELLGLNNTRVISQLAASSLFVGFYDFGTPSGFQGNPGTIGIQTGFDTSVTNTLGGGLLEAAFRFTLFDGDTSVGNFDYNDNTLLVNGIDFGNWSDVKPERTDSTGTSIGLNISGGFRNDILDTGWFYSNNSTTLSNLFNSLVNTEQLMFQIQDTDPFDNFYDFTQGIDRNLINVGQGPVVTPPPGGGTSVPEPASLALLGIGLAGLGFTRRRKRA